MMESEGCATEPMIRSFLVFVILTDRITNLTSSRSVLISACYWGGNRAVPPPWSVVIQILDPDRW